MGTIRWGSGEQEDWPEDAGEEGGGTDWREALSRGLPPSSGLGLGAPTGLFAETGLFPARDVLSEEEAVRMGTSLLARSPERRVRADAATRALSRLTGRPEGRFVHELVGGLGFWVADLPSRPYSSHHEPFGLLEYSLEVAEAVLWNLEARWMSGGSPIEVATEERPLWARVGFALGLFYDIGFVLEIAVRDPRTGAEWDPLEEPLSFFKRRAGRSFEEPMPVEMRDLSGPESHGGREIPLVLRLLPGATRGLLRPFLQAALRYYLDTVPGTFPMPLSFLGEMIREVAVSTRIIGGRKVRFRWPSGQGREEGEGGRDSR
jgi:hypothetical protein